MALFLEESLFRGTQWVVFEPNDEPLWSQIRLNIDAFMQTLFRQGAFQGSDAARGVLREVRRETTTQADINLGIVNIHVGFAPLKPAEFVVHPDPADRRRAADLSYSRTTALTARRHDRRRAFMPQFPVNPQRLNPYPNFKFRREVGRPLRRRHCRSARRSSAPPR